MCDRLPLCTILPPHMLDQMAAKGSDAERQRALSNIALAGEFRGERRVLGSMPALLGIAPGQKRRSVYDAQHGVMLPGQLMRSEGQAASADVAANEAYDGAGATYDFFRTVFGRNSIDGKGMRLDSTVHFDQSFDNAMWNGQQMVYGDGDGVHFNRFTISLDVIGHELTHGITQATAGLEYHDQPGALNEHFSDVFGSLVKQYSLKQTAAKADWLIGAGLFTKSVHGTALRSMKNPGTAYDDPFLGKDPQPADMAHLVQTALDHGGVHINSGIPNRAFYLVAIALGGNAWGDAGQIWYRALTQKVRPSFSFAQCAEATVQSATELFGANTLQCKAVRDAWTQVGVVSKSPATKKGKKPQQPVAPS